MSIDRSRRIHFEQVADLYAAANGEYPAAWVEDILKRSLLPPGGRILEIGCGPGNATLSFARRGYRVLAVELGIRMCQLARERCALFPSVEVVCQAFEDWPLEENAFDLALAADSIHWIEPEVSYPKIAAALRPGGCLAVSAMAPVENPAPWVVEVDAVYREMAPELSNPDNRFTVEWLIEVASGAIDASGLFGPVSAQSHAWSETQDAEAYIRDLRTYSGHHGLEDEFRERLYDRIRQVICRYGVIEQPRMAVVFVATKK